ncbi:hypothetical protein [Bradyrhizobium sp. NAS80.1]|uniref:hypothetical protein n=1 Tax=Bradyrhizobium sp. NAS80.1 TaxID=1680159 RepID=UPI0011613038|nr:hypothetical protein [Bradyrhizobium sp. NAS80.1]
MFVAEGAPGPVLQWSFLKNALGPARKILVFAGVSEELENSSPQNASAVVGRVLADATNKSIDTIAFDFNPGNLIRPPGLLNGVTATAPAATATFLAETITADVANLVGAIGAAGIDPSDAVLIAGPREVTWLNYAGFTNAIPSLGVAAKTVIAIAPAGLASAYQGPPEIQTSKEATLHRETNPAEIVGSDGAVAAPSTSLFQSYLIAVRVRARAAWCVAPGAAQYVTNVNW